MTGLSDRRESRTLYVPVVDDLLVTPLATLDPSLFRRRHYHEQLNALSATGTYGIEEVTVVLEPLDELGLDPVVVKIDTEEHELSCLDGMVATIERCRPIFMIERNPQEDEIGSVVDERKLVDSAPDRLASDLVVAPHHGSRSSSSNDFIAATSPAYVVYATGWGNRYGFPAAEVTQRWAASGARGVNTATAGTIGFQFDARTGIGPPDCERVEVRRFWWHVGGSAAACHAVSSPD